MLHCVQQTDIGWPPRNRHCGCPTKPVYCVFSMAVRWTRSSLAPELFNWSGPEGMRIGAKRFNITKSAHCYSLEDQLQSQYTFNHRLEAIKTGGGPVVLC